VTATLVGIGRFVYVETRRRVAIEESRPWKIRGEDQRGQNMLQLHVSMSCPRKSTPLQPPSVEVQLILHNQGEWNGVLRFAGYYSQLVAVGFHPGPEKRDLRCTTAWRDILVSKPAALPVQLHEQRVRISIPGERDLDGSFMRQREIEPLAREQIRKTRRVFGVEWTESAMYSAVEG
jgi:hypothetical protein